MGRRRSGGLVLLAVAAMVLASLAPAAGAAVAPDPGALPHVLAPNHRVPRSGSGLAAATAAIGWTSSNWSGYAVTSGAPYKTITGVWVVPKVAPTGTPSFSAAWIGIDGFDNNSLIQAGTEEDYYLGSAHYSAWWTTSDHGFVEQNIPTLTVHPGDLMLCIIGQTATPGTWAIILIDATTGQSFVKTTPYAGPGDSAEWILEAPTVGSQVGQLAAYGATIFDAGTVNGASPNLQPNDGGALVQNGVQVSTPSDPDNGPPPKLPDGFGIANSATAPPPPNW
jgi:hypothetical protein